MSAKNDSGKQYHRESTGLALDTVKRHGAEEDITLFGSCFCPFVQRVWVAFEYLGIPYKYYEVDPYAKPKELLEFSPKGLVPGLKLHRFDPPRALNESTVIMEYLEDLAAGLGPRTLLPPLKYPYARALVRLQADHVNRAVVPAFYRYLQAQDVDAQIAGGKEFHASLEQLAALFERAERELVTESETALGAGLWKEGGEINWADIMVGPCKPPYPPLRDAHRAYNGSLGVFRATNVLKHYRGFEVPSGPKFDAWLKRLLEHPAFRSTCSTEQLCLDSCERYGGAIRLQSAQY
ncbi:hypothetical protein EVG20_g776 [Dentipellis fragilis]|uniref:GST N-terminal domain-containing protein n=1 Tax=Dentipellis fragilis TaxID=205917 RepID=A0A4Y9ZEM9_9AGAM|nr:hypothetical protein EVG20_g776 [Dentipellis fragilis]